MTRSVNIQSNLSDCTGGDAVRVKPSFSCCLVFGLLLCLLNLVPAAMPAADLNLGTAFDEANRLYEQGKFGAAADAYEQLLQSGQSTPAVHFNLGNARYRNGELGRAIVAFLNAQHLAPRDADIGTNLQLARRAVGGADAEGPGFVERMIARLSPFEWAMIGGIAFALFFILLCLRELKPQLRTAFRGILIFCAALTLVGGVCARMAFQQGNQQLGVITSREITVRYTPLEESPVHYTAVDGAELRILGRKAGTSGKPAWLEVQDSNGRVGWLLENQITLVKP